MKIAYLVSEFPGISHTFILREIEELKNNNVEVVTVSINSPQNLEKMDEKEKLYYDTTLYLKRELKKNLFKYFFKMFTPQGINIFFSTVRLNYFKGPKSLIKTVGYFLEELVLLAHLKKLEVDHIHIHFANPAASLVLPINKHTDINYSLSVHGPEIFYNTDKNLLEEKFRGAVFIRGIGFFCRSQIMRFLDPKQWEKIHMVPCGVDPEIYRRSELPRNETVNIVSVGRLTPSKGQIIILKALNRLAKKGLNFKLNIIGGGIDDSLLKSYTKENNLETHVKFLGVKSREETKEFLKKMDIFTLPSFAEGIPVSLMEAMSMEIPVVSTIINGIPELIQDGKNGFLVMPSDIEGLSEIFEKLILDDVLRKKIGEEGRKIIKNKYNIYKSADKMVELFKTY
ncbi:glycosyltransferase family 4 protein [Psychrilyobacter atlanticus]|uniref:glycosyltransferase family 4 protein n=1 Tax=Psychrilyobacter atlanticus TaxID=271091 RepID=UPI0004276DA6|nr:glycosyltransferase family 4 protein [Psychrilyobacter atlanticus]